MYLYMCTAACSFKRWPQERAGAVNTFLITFVSGVFLSKLRIRSRYRYRLQSCCLVVLLLCQNVGNFFPHKHTHTHRHSQFVQSISSFSLFHVLRSLSYIPRIQNVRAYNYVTSFVALLNINILSSHSSMRAPHNVRTDALPLTHSQLLLLSKNR